MQFDKTNKDRRLPTVFSHAKAMQVLSFMAGDHKLAASLMYGSGLRVMEAVCLRVQDVDFEQQCLIIRETKGDKWRRTLLPCTLMEPLQAQIAIALAVHQQDLNEGYGEVSTAQRYIQIARDKRADLAEKSAAHISAALAGSSKSE